MWRPVEFVAVLYPFAGYEFPVCLSVAPGFFLMLCGGSVEEIMGCVVLNDVLAPVLRF